MITLDINKYKQLEEIKPIFIEKMETDGMFLIENMISEEMINNLKNDLEKAIDGECEYHNSKNFNDYGMVLFCGKYGGELLNIFNYDTLFTPFEWLLGEDCIVYSNTSSSMPPKSTNYSNRVHIDSPIDYPNNYPLRVLSLVILDDFTEDNGSTWFLPNSHNLTEQPTDTFFYQNAKRLNAKRGSILYWNPKIWHAGGENNSEKWRHAFTIVMTRHFMKQRMDIPKIIDDTDHNIFLSENAKKRLGYYHIPPINYQQYYGKI